MNLIQYLTDSGHRSRYRVWWNFEFPNNRGASVRPSKALFRFDVEFDDLEDGLELACGLDAVQVEALLAEIANSDRTI